MSRYERLPDSGTQEYLWWQAGAQDEARERNEGLNSEAQDARDVLVGLARLNPAMSTADLAAALARIYCPEKLRRRHR